MLQNIRIGSKLVASFNVNYPNELTEAIVIDLTKNQAIVKTKNDDKFFKIYLKTGSTRAFS